MKEFLTLGAATPEESAREIAHRALARKAAAEGIVLLKTDGVLPLVPGKIALYGAGSRRTVKGGSGSGDVRERHSVTVEEGLLQAGFSFPTTLWMDRFEERYRDDLTAWRKRVDAAIKGYGPLRTMDMFIKIGEFPKPYPACTPILPDELTDETDTAIYVLSRQAGEGSDRRVEKGDYLLSDMEEESLKLLSKRYQKLILVLNCGSVVDLSILDEVRIDAVLFAGQPGMEGGNALADILSGKASPSGRLTDTWAYHYADYPCADTFGHRNGDLENEAYSEGVYVGYRYFETFGVKPRYPFGYGLSYTAFTHTVTAISLIGETFTLTVNVVNTGGYRGKEVLQLYAAKPSGRIHAERLSLVAFAKTAELPPSGSEDVTLTFPVKDLSVFDGAFILQRGEYGIYLGTDVERINAAAVLNVEADVTVERVDAIAPKLKFRELTSGAAAAQYDGALPRYTVENVVPVTHKAFEPRFSKEVNDLLNRLSARQKISLVVGGGYAMNGYVSVMGGAGRTNTNLLKSGIPNIMMADGPAGLNVMPQNACTKSGSPRYPDGLPADWQWGWLRHAGRLVKGNPKKLSYAYRYATAFPSETCLAQSFDLALLEEVGGAVGTEMREFGISVWLAPGMNIHRNPLCGRNFEYYSEDPLVSGKMAAAITRGVQSVGGVGVCIKHFCCNNQEDNRTGVSANLSERALREIYLRPFRIAIGEGKPWTVMSSYNRVNGKYVCNDKGLLTGVLRDEWGFQGLVMSDWNAVEQGSYLAAIHSGNDMIMPGTKNIIRTLCRARGNIDMSALNTACARVLELILNSRTTHIYRGSAT